MNERRINLCLIAKCIIVATLLFTGDIRGDKSIGKEKPILTYAILGKELWILNADGKANIYDLDSLKQLRVYQLVESSIRWIEKETDSTLLIADRENKIIRLSVYENRSDFLFNYDDGIVYRIISNSLGKIFLITDKGIFDPEQKKHLEPIFSINSTFAEYNNWQEPSAIYLDKSDNIWIGFDRGEWGGELFIFNSRKKGYKVPILKSFQELNDPVRSFFEINDSIYITYGLNHLGAKGQIVKVTDYKAQIVFESKYDEGEYIGPGTFNSFDQSIYYYSNLGIFKGEINSDLTARRNWRLFFQPKMKWQFGQSNAVGYQMNVKDLKFIRKDTLLIFAPQIGLGIYRGNKLHFLN
ncbi:hypothetical protein [Leptospira interrogans]|uniref:hypothetical protein n=1 Tax=Leptospira interrogans TaxID=173 RepID=UPI000772EEE4|nr:hypothetical protein [Leptospira interrogans]WOT13193.1 hypothetical protein CFY92_0020290 [Leptospira interrogans]